MNLLLWIFLMDISLMLCQESTSTTNLVLSRSKRNHENDALPKTAIIQKIRPLVIYPVRGMNIQRNNVKLNTNQINANSKVPTESEPYNNSTALTPLERAVNARKRILNTLNNRKLGDFENNNKNDLDLKQEMVDKINKMVNNPKNIITNLNEDKTGMKTTNNLIKESSSLNKSQSSIKVKDTPFKSKVVGTDVKNKNVKVLQHNTKDKIVNTDKNETIFKPKNIKDRPTLEETKGDKQLSTEIDKLKTTKIKENNKMIKTSILTPAKKKEIKLMKELLKQGKKSEVITANNYDHMYSKTSAPFYFIEKDKKLNQVPMDIINASDEQKGEIDKSKDESKKSKINKDYVENLLKIEKLPPIELKSVVSKAGETKFNETTAKFRDGNLLEDRTGSSKVPADAIDSNETTAIYIEKESFNELNEDFNKASENKPSHITPHTHNLDIEYDIISPNLDDHNQLYYDCNLSNTALVSPCDYRPSNTYVPNQYPYSFNAPTNNKVNPYYNQNDQGPLGNGRNWKNTNMYLISNGLPIANPLVYRPTVQLVANPYSYGNPNAYHRH